MNPQPIKAGQVYEHPDGYPLYILYVGPIRGKLRVRYSFQSQISIIRLEKLEEAMKDYPYQLLT